MKSLVSPGGEELLADAELPDNFPVAVGIDLLQVVQKTAALAHEHQETAARAMVLFVRLEVLSEFANALAQDRDLDFGASRVRFVRTELLNNLGFLYGCQHSGFVLLILYSLNRLATLVVSPLG